MVVIEEVSEVTNYPVFNGGCGDGPHLVNEDEAKTGFVGASNYRSPFVFWAQDKDHIFLKVDVQDSVSPVIKIQENTLEVITEGCGAGGVNLYRSFIKLLHPIVEKESTYTVLASHIDVRLVKLSQDDWWPKLHEGAKKLPWLKLDFDRWKNEEEEEDEEEEENERMAQLKRSMHEQGQGEDSYSSRLERELDMAEERAYAGMKNLYLIVYNLIMFIGFSYVFWFLALRMYWHGPDAYSSTIESVGTPIAVLQCLALAEVVHPILGIVRSGVLQSLMQLWGRNFVLFFVIFAQEGLQEAPHVHWLFFVWSAIEIVRYPFYMLKSTGENQGKLLTWLRYTIWIPLYPAGMLLEVAVINAAVPLFEMSGKYSFKLPNSLNFAFDFASVLRLYIFLYPVAGLYMLKHMWTQRKKVLGGKSTKYSKKSSPTLKRKTA